MVAAIAYPTTVRSQSIILQNYDQSSVPENKGGDTYPSSYVGISNIGIDTTDRAPQTSGNSLKFDFGGQLQFNPYTGSPREYTRNYANCGYPVVCGSSPWQTNTYTKLQYWVKVPTNSPSVDYGAGSNYNVGIYAKSYTNGDPNSDEQPGGGHFYYSLWLEGTGTWWQVILNMHPDHERGDPGNQNFGYHPYITAEREADPANTYNLWDTLTRWYFEVNYPTGAPTYNLDNILFTTATVPEDEVHISALAGTYVPGTNRVIVNWARVQGQDQNWDVRYAFSDIHALGWNNATVAPNSPVHPKQPDQTILACTGKPRAST